MRADYQNRGTTMDLALVEEVLRGDPVSERRFVERYVRYIRAFALRHEVPSADAEDLCQDVMLRLWEDDKRRLRLWHCRRYPEASENRRFTAFLAVVTANLLCDRRRAEASLCRLRQDAAARANMETHLASSQPDQALLEKARDEVLYEAMRSLSARDADLLSRRYLRGESYREIATGTGRTVSWVGVTLGRAEQRLRDRLLASNVAVR